MVRLAKAGLPVVMAQQPRPPGKNKTDEFAKLYAELMALENVSATAEVIKQKPLVEGDNLPEFWCRRDGEELFIFFANPAAQRLTYPLRYGQAFEDKGSQREITINTKAGAQPLTLKFNPNESLMVKVTEKGTVEMIDLDFTAKKIE